ncbi:MAG: thioredoxin family protein [Leptospirales bacterium]|nr:thioredoxin family protein [Leptospirales bacterium]
MKRSLARLLTGLILGASISLLAAEHPAKQIQIKYKENIIVPPGGTAAFDVMLTVPANYHIYLSHATPKGNAILTQISVPAQSGFQLRETKRPPGKQEGDEMVLRGAGTFSLTVMDLAKVKTGTTTKVPVQIKVQICKDDPALCYLPITIEKTLTIQKAGTPFSNRASTSNLVKWTTSYDQAIAQAKSRKLNVFALISNPATCGACVYLDSETLSKQDVADFLNKKFVPLNVPRGDYHRFVSG